MRRLVLPAVALALVPACRSAPAPAPRGDEILVAGTLVPTGTRVVRFDEPGGYDAYRPDGPPCYGEWRRDLPPDVERRARATGWTVGDLRAVVSQVVVHYDAAGSAKRCFEILKDERGLSSHFLIDTDGTVYQTLDVKERAWHAGTANDRSVGIEVANIGAWPRRDPVDAWYAANPVTPARPGPIRGRIQGTDLYQTDFTAAQYEALAHLVAALCRTLDVPADAPRDPDGRVRTTVLAPEGIREFAGIVGHLHVSEKKVDPGPAFDWEGFLERVREINGSVGR
jgi:N-acetyl-anhydromuramyl-L-alanine amidase AmpD